MRLNSQRNSQKSDFDDFTRFLGLNGQRNMSMNTQNVRGSVGNCAQNGYVSGAKCDISNDNREAHEGKRSLAMVYPIKQDYIGIYDPEIALINGTIFEELYKPFLRGSCRGANDKGEGCF